MEWSDDPYLMNRIGNCQNWAQGDYKKVLCVCSAGLLRSPTAALVLSQEPFKFNTRAAGLVKAFALIPVDQVLITWADEIVCMSSEHKEGLEKLMMGLGLSKPIVCLDIPDTHEYRSDKLQWLIKEKYQALKEEKQNG